MAPHMLLRRREIAIASERVEVGKHSSPSPPRSFANAVLPLASCHHTDKGRRRRGKCGTLCLE